jgi:transcriptional regulator with XRE-family HTH domain
MKNISIKTRIADYIRLLMQAGNLTQAELSLILGISQGSLSKYLNAKEVPNVELLMKLADLGRVSMDDLLKKDIDSASISVHGNNTLSPIAGGDVHGKTIMRKAAEYKYIPQPDDITPEQANRLQELVNQIVQLGKNTKTKPKGHAAIWNTFQRKFKVGYYREVKQDAFPEAEAYLMKWIGQLKRGLKRSDEEQWRKERYKTIFSAAKNRIGWDRRQVNDFIYSLFEKDNIRDLADKELEEFYQKIISIKQKE